jgi:hypothetical protein
MTLSSFLWLIGLQLTELINKLLDGKTRGTGASNEFAHQLIELALAFDFVALEFRLGDEGAGALLGFEHAADFEFAIGPDDGIGVDGKIDGHLTHGGELIAGGQQSSGHPSGHLIDDLTINGDSAVRVEPEGENPFPVLDRSLHLN